MRKAIRLRWAAFALLLPLPISAADVPSWNAKSAAAYLDGRAAWWSAWPRAARDHDTFCVSCHTALPYALGRAALSSALGEQETAAPERQLLQNIRKRVALWSEVQPFYNDARHGPGKSAEARATEAVIEALILTDHDRRSGQFTNESRQALDHMMALQLTEGENAGPWTWLDFLNQPWEAPDSAFWGAALAARALGNAANSYRAQVSVASGLEHLRTYFARTAAICQQNRRIDCLRSASISEPAKCRLDFQD